MIFHSDIKLILTATPEQSLIVQYQQASFEKPLYFQPIIYASLIFHPFYIKIIINNSIR